MLWIKFIHSVSIIIHVKIRLVKVVYGEKHVRLGISLRVKLWLQHMLIDDICTV